MDVIYKLTQDLVKAVESLEGLSLQIEALNKIRQQLHEVSPLKHHPVDCVLWLKAEEVEANDYNPNSVAPPELALLEHSIEIDGYTQPIVTWADGERVEVIDGFHRTKVGKESSSVREQTYGLVPVVVTSRVDRNDRIAATIRHNRARGRHQVNSMTDIVLELARRNWSDARIGKELGMSADEVLRLKQISGLAELFAHESFSEAWESA